MAKKFGSITGIHNIFNSLSDLEQKIFKSEVTEVDSNSIIYFVADDNDSVFNVVPGCKYIWALGKLIGNDFITKIGNETITGNKTFLNDIIVGNISDNKSITINGVTNIVNSILGNGLVVWTNIDNSDSALKFANDTILNDLGLIGIAGPTGTFVSANKPFWKDSDAYYQLVYSTAKTAIGNSNTPVYIDSNGQILICDSYPTSFPVNGGMSDYAKYLRGRTISGEYFNNSDDNNIIAEWDTMSDNRWYLTAVKNYECRVDYSNFSDNAITLDGKPVSYFVNTEDHTLLESVVVEALNDLDKRINTVNSQFNSHVHPYLPLEGGILTGQIEAIGFKKTGSSSEYVLLGDGGHSKLKKINNIDLIGEGNISITAGENIDLSPYALKSEIGNGTLILKYGETIIDNTFTANKKDNTIIDLKNYINPSILDDTDTEEINGDENEVEDTEPFTDYQGSFTLKFWNGTKDEYIFNRRVHSVKIINQQEIIDFIDTVTYLYLISFIIDINTLAFFNAEENGLVNNLSKLFYVRGANTKNNICSYDVRGNCGINTVYITLSGNFLYVTGNIKLNVDSGGANAIMDKVKNKLFNGYLCLRTTP